MSTPRRLSRTGSPLPSTRVISNKAISGHVTEHDKLTVMIVAFGQFLDHDLDHVPILRSEFMLF